MLATLRNGWKILDLRKKILFTFAMLIIYRLGAFVPVPGIDVAAMQQLVGDNSVLSFLDILAGGSLSRYTIFAMGITPYINASIIMNLLTVAIPKLEEIAKEGEEGKKKIAKMTRYFTVILAFVTAIGLTVGFAGGAVENNNFFTYFLIVISLTAGTAFLMWLGEQITESGLGNGISVIIFASIVSRIPSAAIDLFNRTFEAETMSVWLWIPILVGIVALVMAVLFVDLGERRVPVQYAKRVKGNKMIGGSASRIPMKVNSSGVLPIIFAMSFLQLPQLLSMFFDPASGFAVFMERYFSSQSVPYAVLYFLLIIFFAYFYTTISFNPVEIANNLQKNGGFIPGIRPGWKTVDYIGKISRRLTLAGGLFLGMVAIIPIALTWATGISMYFGGTAILIMVNVSLETVRQMESQLLMRHYKGFLE